ncbi:MAG: hypothetical protein Kow0070_28360 [Anaerolineales bacterium]
MGRDMNPHAGTLCRGTKAHIWIVRIIRTIAKADFHALRQGFQPGCPREKSLAAPLIWLYAKDSVSTGYRMDH